jgi:hypothetical protein
MCLVEESPFGSVAKDLVAASKAVAEWVKICMETAWSILMVNLNIRVFNGMWRMALVIHCILQKLPSFHSIRQSPSRLERIWWIPTDLTKLIVYTFRYRREMIQYPEKQGNMNSKNLVQKVLVLKTTKRWGCHSFVLYSSSAQPNGAKLREY